MTKRYLASLLCALFFLAWIAIDANAQASGKAAVQSHLAAAKAAAYEPGNDLTTLYDTVCAPALSDRGPREPDIQALAESRAPQTGPRSEWHTEPEKDMVATDGMKLTLGDTTLTLYITPGHTPGTISILVPLKDGNERHVGAVWGGINADVGRNGVRYFPSMAETFKTWIASARRFQDIAAKANADVYLTLHPFYDKALDKLHALNFRKPGGPHPFVSKDNLNRFLTIIRECTEAQLASISS